MTDEIYELSCNLDDMTGEELGFAMEVLLSAGALDVYTLPIGMKKNRPGVMLNVLCRPEKREELVRLLFLHTTNHLGSGETPARPLYPSAGRKRLRRPPFGPVRGKPWRAMGSGASRNMRTFTGLPWRRESLRQARRQYLERMKKHDRIPP